MRFVRLSLFNLLMFPLFRGTNAGVGEQQGGFYIYDCPRCNCDASYTYNPFTVKTPCLNVGGGSWIGVTIGASSQEVLCRVYPEENCAGSAQTVSVHEDSSWGCTESQVGSIASVLCEADTQIM